MTDAFVAVLGPLLAAVIVYVTVVPATTSVTPSLFVIDRSPEGLQVTSAKSDSSVRVNRLVSATNVDTASFRIRVSAASPGSICT